MCGGSDETALPHGPPRARDVAQRMESVYADRASAEGVATKAPLARGRRIDSAWIIAWLAVRGSAGAAVGAAQLALAIQDPDLLQALDLLCGRHRDEPRVHIRLEGVAVGIRRAGVLRRHNCNLRHGSEVAKDTVRITDCDLDVRLRHDPGTRERWSSFREDPAYRLVVSPIDLLVEVLEAGVEDRAVEVPQEKVVVPVLQLLVLGQGLTGCFDQEPEFLVPLLKGTGCARVGQVEATTEVDEGTEHERLADLASCLHPFSPLQRPSRPVFPEVNALTEPVVGVRTRLEVHTVEENGLTDAAITAVVPDDEALVVD